MDLWQTRRLCTAATLVALATGCGSGPLAPRPAATGRVTAAERYILTADPGSPRWAARPVAGETLTTSTPPAEATAPAAGLATQPAGVSSRPLLPATRPAGEVGHTKPSERARSIALGLNAGTSLLLSAFTLGAGREAGESKVGAGGGLSPQPRGLTDRPGLGGAQPGLTNAVWNRPGLQRGLAAGLGFAGARNVLTRQGNPVAGSCPGLVRAGFFSTQTACQARFQR